jgi:hypothetical protein
VGNGWPAFQVRSAFLLEGLVVNSHTHAQMHVPSSPLKVLQRNENKAPCGNDRQQSLYRKAHLLVPLRWRHVLGSATRAAFCRSSCMQVGFFYIAMHMLRVLKIESP